MGIQLDEALIALLRDETSTKVLATVGADGAPHAVVKQSLSVDGEGQLVHLELLESSRTNKNLLRALWSDGRVSVLVRGGAESWQVKGRPLRADVAGPEFQEEYVRIRARLGDVDLAARWVIEPEEVIRQSFAVRRAQEELAHPHFVHLDRIRAEPGPAAAQEIP